METQPEYRTIIRLPDGRAEGLRTEAVDGKIEMVARVSGIDYIIDTINGQFTRKH